jgi:hypothetical protein
MTEFEQKIINHLKERNVSDPTIKLYLFQLRQINDGEIENLKKFEDIPKVMEFLKNFKINTQRTKLIAIIAMLKTFPEKKDLQDKYSNIVMAINKETNLTSNEKTEKQKENWVTKDEIKDIWTSFEEVIKTFINKKQISEKQYNILLQFVVLSLYTLTNPRRNADYMNMIVIKKITDGLPQNLNYLDLQKKVFIFNNYKTAKTYKQQVEQIPQELFNVLKIYLKYKPQDCPYLLCSYDGNKLPHVNSITLILNKVFNKKVGTSLLRNIFLSDKFDKLQPMLDELKETSNSMGTSASNSLQTYIKK